MSGYLLDTNVVSELSKENPNEAVVRYLNAHDDLWISVIVVEELELGVRLLPEGRRRNELRRWLSQLLTNFEGRMATIGRREAEWAAVFQVRAHLNGRALELGDALIAGTAMANTMTIAARNVKDFGGMDLDILNPWDAK